MCLLRSMRPGKASVSAHVETIYVNMCVTVFLVAGLVCWKMSTSTMYKGFFNC